MSFPRYPAYKDSGVEWLGEVPGHWAIPQVKRTTYLKARVGWKGLTSEEFREKSFAYLVTGSDFREKFVKWDACYQVEQDRYEDDPFIQLKNGDLLITKDGTIGKLAIVSNLDRPACLNSGIFVMRPLSTYTTEFMYWILSSSVFSVFCDLESFGSTINHLYQNVFEQFVFPAPPLPEQTQIAAFLDSETAKIDELVAEQRRLMELLKEKRQAVISHAVTRGLNPDVPMKPSGIEWLGDVPEHWEIKSIRYILEAIGDVDHFMPESVEKGVPYLMTGDLEEFVSDVSLDDCKQVSHNDYLELSKRIKSSKGDVIMARYATIGTLMYVDIDVDFLVSYSCVTLKTNRSKVSGLYLFQYMKSDAFRQGVENQINTNTQGNVGIKDLQNVKIAVAPIDEQTAIAAFLDSETTKFDTLITEAQCAVDLMQERRIALISAAVTGQIDVRGTVTA